MVEQTSKALAEILGQTSKVKDLINEITAASNDQAQGVSQIVIALGQIDQVTQRNTATAEESACAAQELSSQAKELRAMVDQFQLGESAIQPRNNVVEINEKWAS